jgi:sortase (surface protein transpeptidase)
MKTLKFKFIAALFLILMPSAISTATPDVFDIETETQTMETVENKIAAPTAVIADGYKVKTEKKSASKTNRECDGYAGVLKIGAKTLCVYQTTDLGSDAGTRVAHYTGSFADGIFLFGHNSSAVFGNLKNLPVGTVFSYGGANYRINEKKVYCDYSNGNLCTTKYASDAVLPPSFPAPRKTGHDLNIMTCAGASLGNGDATHRLLVSADRI